jgi:rsbT co-antagonist protein RsbR
VWTTQRPGRATVTCEWSLHPLTAGGAVVYGQDVAARVAAEGQHRIHALMLRALLDNLDIVGFVTDADARVILVDGKGLAATGISPEMILGQDAVALFGTKYPRLREILRGEPLRITTYENGGEFENWLIPMKDAQGKLLALVGAALDVTEIRRRERELQAKLDLIERQQRALRELSTPILEVWDHVICLPIVGLVDAARAAEIMDNLLQAVARTRARYAILDLTGVHVVDTGTAGHLISLIGALRLLGAEGVLTGIHPNIARTIVTLGVDLAGLAVRATLRDALRHVLAALDGAGARARADPR